jgi:hypothetical protein
MNLSDGRTRIGIWAGWDEPVDWMSNDALHVLPFLVEGAAARDTVTFCIHVAIANHDTALQVLRGLAAREGVDWTLTTDPPATRSKSASRGVWLLGRSPAQMRWVLLALVLVIVPLQLLRALLRPVWRLLWRNGLSAMPSLLRAAALGWRDPAGSAATLAPLLQRAPVRPLQRLGRTLTSWANEASDAGATTNARPLCVAALPETDGWLLLGPDSVNRLCFGPLIAGICQHCFSSISAEAPR